MIRPDWLCLTVLAAVKRSLPNQAISKFLSLPSGVHACKMDHDWYGAIKIDHSRREMARAAWWQAHFLGTARPRTTEEDVWWREGGCIVVYLLAGYADRFFRNDMPSLCDPWEVNDMSSLCRKIRWMMTRTETVQEQLMIRRSWEGNRVYHTPGSNPFESEQFKKVWHMPKADSAETVEISSSMSRVSLHSYLHCHSKRIMKWSICRGFFIL